MNSHRHRLGIFDLSAGRSAQASVPDSEHDLACVAEFARRHCRCDWLEQRRVARADALTHDRSSRACGGQSQPAGCAAAQLRPIFGDCGRTVTRPKERTRAFSRPMANAHITDSYRTIVRNTRAFAPPVVDTSSRHAMMRGKKNKYTSYLPRRQPRHSAHRAPPPGSI